MRLEFKKMKIYASEDWEEEYDNRDEIEEIEYELTKKYDEIDLLDKQLGKDNSAFKVDPKNVVEQMFKNKIILPTKGLEKNEESKSTKDLNKTGLKSPKSSRINEFLLRQNDNKKEPPILNAIESLNTDIPENQEKFRAYYGGLRPMLKNNIPAQEETLEKFLDTEDGDEDNKSEKIDLEKTISTEK